MRSDLSFADPVQAALLCALLALFASAAILWVLLRTGWAWRLATDIPNDRSLHVRPTPRVGGWGVVPAAAVLICRETPALWLIALLAVALAIMSQIDDRRGLPARLRFGCHVIAVAAVIVVYPADTGWWILAIVAFFLVWLVNLYNFMDGSDGLAGGMAVFGFGGYAVVALTSAHSDISLGLASASVAGAAAGFLLFNFHPAKVFLGDAGSIPIGFLAGALGYWGWRSGTWPFWLPAMMFSPFIADASVTLLKRLIRGEKFWQAHRDHYYQRMVRSGIGHGRTAILWYLVMLAGIAIAWYLSTRSPVVQLCGIIAWAVVLCILGVKVDLRWRRFQAELAEQSSEVSR
ncbi:MraY family glycosyltransferase [Paraburkholderia hospita]|uniref:MraY family glycosyltransferase n=1 Tax=Paraburkholderia hospita TaxID=169430 RepID=UPI0009A632B9|nr:glycosyltransferase family 4 protein [Paraburkholderia hospita]SKC63843.1 UDP-N-acetylmuramyl pentapeptide phosphotransferase/UDP-N-acetylglucosamine-1-phosphate transferase [Paraburkholderia hospita]